MTHNDINWENRNKVFYIVWNEKDDEGYHISKTQRTFIIDNKVLIRELRNSESRVHEIKEIHYQGDSLITSIINRDYMASESYTGLLTGQQHLKWVEMHNTVKPMNKVTLTKDKKTLIWSIIEEGFIPGIPEWIDSYDILPSGYYYQNQRTTPYDPDKENFLPPKARVFLGIYELNEEPIVLIPDTKECNRMERPYEGTWLEITTTDVGDVVYDYPPWHSGRSFEHLTIEVDKNNILTIIGHGSLGSTESSEPQTVVYYPNDGSYRFHPWAELCFEFRWIDKEKHICQWTIFDIDWNTGHSSICEQKKYINKSHNNLPVIIYDWE